MWGFYNTPESTRLLGHFVGFIILVAVLLLAFAWERIRSRRNRPPENCKPGEQEGEDSDDVQYGGFTLLPFGRTWPPRVG